MDTVAVGAARGAALCQRAAAAARRNTHAAAACAPQHAPLRARGAALRLSRRSGALRCAGARNAAAAVTPVAVMGGGKARPFRPRTASTQPALTRCPHRSRQAAEALEQGKAIYASGERMQALKLFESALKTMARRPTPRAHTRTHSRSCAADFPLAWRAGAAAGGAARAAVQLRLLPRRVRRHRVSVDVPARRVRLACVTPSAPACC
jgi:hypothetical protein